MFDISDSQTIRVAVCGRSGSGKSFYVFNNSNIFDNFNVIVLFSKTITNSQIRDYAKIENTMYQRWIVKQSFDPQVIESLKLKNKQREKQHKKLFHFCVIFDDFGGTTRNDDEIEQLFYLGRHHNISVVCLIQYLRFLTPRVHSQLTHLIIFKLGERSWKALEDEILGEMDEDTIADIPKIKKWINIVNFRGCVFNIADSSYSLIDPKQNGLGKTKTVEALDSESESGDESSN